MQIKIGPEIINTIILFLKDEDRFDSFNVFWTLKVPNVSLEYLELVYIYFNIGNPWNVFWLTFGSSVPKYWTYSRLEQFKNAKSSIFEILDKIVIDFNLEHPSNKLDEISFNCDGSLIDIKLMHP